MTTPVYMSDQSKTMEFVLPKKFLKAKIPVPNDNDVKHTFLNLSIMLQ